jgi:molecular chaperone DnaJ
MTEADTGVAMEGVPGTYYEILGVPRDASDREIKNAYRVLARRLHPDICRESGAEERFKEINEAYRVLSDPGERGRYDALGHEMYRRSPAGFGDPSGQGGIMDFRGFGDAFDLFFSGKAWGDAASFRPRSPSDILIRMEITLEEAVLGTERVVEVPYATRCGSCRGTGSITGKVRVCPRCGGRGGEGLEAASVGFIGPGSPPCRECGGKGKIPDEPCITCGGWGATQETRRVTVHTPPGIDTGMRIRKEGLGKEVDPGIPRGDLYIEVTILPHGRFTRKGDDLEIPVHISPARAALGSVTKIGTIGGKVLRVEIPPGIQHGAPVRVKGGGVKTRERCGDLILRIWIVSPEKITAEERNLYRQLLRIEDRKEEPGKGGVISRYLSKIRDPDK